MTLSQAILSWMETHKRTSVKPSTYLRLQTSYDLMKKYRISECDIEKLTGNDIQSYINDLVDDGYAQTTIKKQFHLISAFLRWANAEGLVLRPLYEAVTLPSQCVVKKPKKEIIAYSEEEQQRLKNVLDSGKKRGYPVIAFMIETGLRVGEVLALQWADIQWQRKAVSVSKTLINLNCGERSKVQNSPKSLASKRVIPLSTNAQRILNSLPKNGTFVFNPDSTEPLSYKVLIKNTKAACKEANVPYMGMHVFRHTFATNCYYRGCDVKILSRLLGHSSVTITYNTYIHLFGDALEEMRAVLA